MKYIFTQTEEAILKTAIQKVFAKHNSDVMAAKKKEIFLYSEGSDMRRRCVHGDRRMMRRLGAV